MLIMILLSLLLLTNAIHTINYLSGHCVAQHNRLTKRYFVLNDERFIANTLSQTHTHVENETLWLIEMAQLPRFVIEWLHKNSRLNIDEACGRLRLSKFCHAVIVLLLFLLLL